MWICIHVNMQTDLCIRTSACIVISGHQAKACLLVKLARRRRHLFSVSKPNKGLVITFSEQRDMRAFWIWTEGGEFFSLPQAYTYMNDMRGWIPVISADEKVNQEQSSIFLIQLGNDVLQPPCSPWRNKKKEVKKKWKERNGINNIMPNDTWKRTKVLYHNWSPSCQQL